LRLRSLIFHKRHQEFRKIKISRAKASLVQNHHIITPKKNLTPALALLETHPHVAAVRLGRACDQEKRDVTQLMPGFS
jgi:hypothetical protein